MFNRILGGEKQKIGPAVTLLMHYICAFRARSLQLNILTTVHVRMSSHNDEHGHLLELIGKGAVQYRTSVQAPI